MENSEATFIEHKAPGADKIDRDWMTTFWEAFSDCVIEMDAGFCVTNILRKPDSTFTMMDIIGKSFVQIAYEKDKALVVNELESLKSISEPYRRFTFLAKGNNRYYRWTLVAVHKDCEFSGLRGIAVDVTEYSLSEITLNWQRAIIEWGADFVSISDMDGNVLYTNPGAYRMTGYDPADGQLLPARVLTPEHFSVVRDEGLKKTLEEGSWTGQGELVRKDGSRLPIEQTMYSVGNKNDDSFLVATIIRDITQLLEHERTLEEARKAAEAASVAKSEFLSRMSHEIRTPMNAILGMIHIGLEANDIEKKNYSFKRADLASQHLLNIINDILDMSKIEADKFELSYSEFEFEKTIKSIIDMASVRIEEKNQNFVVAISNDVPVSIISDKLRLSQVITNLLTNAIKFTPEKGTVELSISKIEDIGNEVILRFEVIDTGIGITKEQQERLFTSFNQANSSIAQNYGGTGLGLAIAKSIVEMLGGGIWIESELGKGSSFIFTIKAKKGGGTRNTNTTPDEEEKPRYDFSRHTLLIAEDIEINREIIAAILEDTGVAIDYAENGKDAVSMFMEDPGKYGLILMDINMPIMDGYEATTKIRELDSYVAKDIPIIAMTANAFKEDIDKCLACGMNGHTGKPINIDALLELLGEYLDRRV